MSTHKDTGKTGHVFILCITPLLQLITAYLPKMNKDIRH